MRRGRCQRGLRHWWRRWISLALARAQQPRKLLLQRQAQQPSKLLLQRQSLQRPCPCLHRRHQQKPWASGRALRKSHSVQNQSSPSSTTRWPARQSCSSTGGSLTRQQLRRGPARPSLTRSSRASIRSPSSSSGARSQKSVARVRPRHRAAAHTSATCA